MLHFNLSPFFCTGIIMLFFYLMHISSCFQISLINLCGSYPPYFKHFVVCCHYLGLYHFSFSLLSLKSPLFSALLLVDLPCGTSLVVCFRFHGHFEIHWIFLYVARISTLFLVKKLSLLASSPFLGLKPALKTFI